MEKEICILKNFRNILDATTDTDCIELDKAIKTIEEAMKPKTCDGCKYEDGEIYKTLIEHGHNIHICSLCLRGTNDYFKPKANA